MGGIIEDIRERNATKLDAAKELGRGLMRGERPKLKLGYSWENAALAAERYFKGATIEDGIELRIYLLGFAQGMIGERSTPPDALDQLAKLDRRYEDALDAGYVRGLDEPAHLTYPALQNDAPAEVTPEVRERALDIVDGLIREAGD